MRAFTVFVLLLTMGSMPTKAADPPRLAIFDLEMLDTSLQGQMNGPRADEHEGLLRAGDQLRQELGEPGKFRIVDISPVNVAAHQSNLQACGGCDVKLAQQLNADLDMTGLVQRFPTSFSTSISICGTFTPAASWPRRVPTCAAIPTSPGRVPCGI